MADQLNSSDFTCIDSYESELNANRRGDETKKKKSSDKHQV